MQLVNDITWPEDPEFWKNLESGKDVLLKARGNSMKPLYHDGTIFLIRKESPENIRLGDILLMMNVDGSLILHRFLGWSTYEKKGLITKGDWRDRPDNEWPVSSFFGRVNGAVGKNGTFRPINTRLAAFLANVSLPAGIALGFIRSAKRKIMINV